MPTRRTQKSARHIYENFYDSASDEPTEIQIWAYSDRLSYQDSQRLELHGNTTAQTYSIEIFRDAAVIEERYAESDLPGTYHSTLQDCSTNGCDWPVGWGFDIPENWCSGVYLMVLRASVGQDLIGGRGNGVLNRPVNWRLLKLMRDTDKTELTRSFYTSEHDICDGAVKLLRTKQSGDVWQMRVWISKEKKREVQSEAGEV
jgi:hypothetical protein